MTVLELMQHFPDNTMILSDVETNVVDIDTGGLSCDPPYVILMSEGMLADDLSWDSVES